MSSIIDPENFKIDESVTRGLEYGYTARQANEIQEGNRTVTNPAAIIVPAVISGITAIANIISANRRQKEQNKYNEEMIDKQNAYNSPAAQMERYREAGLNPYLAMSQGGVSAGTQEQTQEKGAAPGLSGLDFSQLVPLLSLYSQMQMNQANITKAQAESRLKAAQALTETAKQRYYDSQTNRNNYWTNTFAPAQVENIQASKDLTYEKIKYLGASEMSKINLNYVNARYQEAMIDRLTVMNGLTRAQTAEAYAQVKHYQAQVMMIQEDIKRSVSQRDLLEYDKALKEAQRNATEAMARLTGEKEVWYPITSATDAFGDIMSIFH